MKLNETALTVSTLANASELTFNIVNGVMGNDVADTFNGSPLTRGTIYNLTQAQVQAALAPHLKAIQNA